jgi:hypothetical protein
VPHADALLPYRLTAIIEPCGCNCDNPLCPTRILQRYFAARYAIGAGYGCLVMMGRN